jgi:hypothetical protein
MADNFDFKMIKRLEHTSIEKWKLADWKSAAMLLVNDLPASDDIEENIYRLVVGSVRGKIQHHGNSAKKTKLGRPRKMDLDDAKNFLEVVEQWRVYLAEDLGIPTDKLSYNRLIKERLKSTTNKQRGGKSKQETFEYFVGQIKYSKRLLKIENNSMK